MVLLQGKIVLHIQARGGFYSEGPLTDLELGNRYLKQVMGFFGTFEGLLNEGHVAMPDKTGGVKAAGMRAKQLAQNFKPFIIFILQFVVHAKRTTF